MRVSLYAAWVQVIIIILNVYIRKAHMNPVHNLSPFVDFYTLPAKIGLNFAFIALTVQSNEV